MGRSWETFRIVTRIRSGSFVGIQYKYQPRRLPDKVIPLLLNFIMNIPVKLTGRARVVHGSVARITAGEVWRSVRICRREERRLKVCPRPKQLIIGIQIR